LTSKQKALLFESFVNIPPDYVIFEAANREKSVVIDDAALAGMRKAGYSEEQLKRIQDNLKEAFEE